MVEPSRKPYARSDTSGLTPKNFRIFSLEQDGMAWQQLIRADNSNDATRAARKISALPCKEPELLTHRTTAKKKNNERKFETDQGCFEV